MRAERWPGMLWLLHQWAPDRKEAPSIGRARGGCTGMVHPASPDASPRARGLSRRVLLRRGLSLAVTTVGLVTFTGCSIISAAPDKPGIPRIGVLTPDARWWDSFRRSLSEAGWNEGQGVIVEWRSAEAEVDRLPGLAVELVRLPVDLIATVSSEATLAAQQATRSIPIVFLGISDPVGTGLVQSLARPGGNVTGTTQSVGRNLLSKKLSLLTELLPGLARVVFMQNFSSPATFQAEDAETAADQLGIDVKLLDVRADADLELAFATARSWQAGALMVGGDVVLRTRHQRIVELAAHERLPAIYNESTQVERGGLLSYGPNMDELIRRAATYHVDRILRGARPADLPVEQATTFDLAVNLTTAQALGLRIPPAFAAQVTQWIQ
jgi:putative ABC transport system substrate-binding protein